MAQVMRLKKSRLRVENVRINKISNLFIGDESSL